MDKVKDALGLMAADQVQEGMLVGLGTGSTASCFIRHLAKRCSKGLKITAVATSEASAKLAMEKGIEVLDLDETDGLDITFDGADLVDEQKNLVKGFGGAHLREKIVAFASKELHILVDESKLCKSFKDFVLPLELIPFAFRQTILRLQELGYSGQMRMGEQRELFKTDNGNYVFDLSYSGVCSAPKTLEETVLKIPGVVETGFFLGVASKVYVGDRSGQVRLLD